MATRKDYERMADVLFAAQHMPHLDTPEQMRSHIMRTIAYRFAQDNPRFDEQRFINACNQG